MRVTAILLMAGLLVGETLSAVPARAWTAERLPGAPAVASPLALRADDAPSPPASSPFPRVEVPRAPHRSHRLALGLALGGAALVGSSFAWRNEGDRRYGAYLAEADPAKIESRWRATVRADQISNVSLLTGEGLVAAAVWLRFLHHAPGPSVAIVPSPGAVAVAVRW